VSADGSVPCGSSISIQSHLTSDQSTVDGSFQYTVSCDPIISLGPVTLQNSSGEPITAAAPDSLISVDIQLKNSGVHDATGVSGELDYQDVTSQGETWGTIAGGGELTHTYLVRTPATCVGSWSYSLAVSTDQLETRTFDVEIPSACGLRVVALTWDDRNGGNGDGLPQPGETGLVSIKVKNVGRELTSVQATASLLSIYTGQDNAGVEIANNPVSFGDVEPGAEAVGTPVLSVHVNDAASTVPSDGECLYQSRVNGVDFDSYSDEFLRGEFVPLTARLAVTSDQGSFEVSSQPSAVCAASLFPTAHPGGGLPATGARILDWTELALAMIAAGMVLRGRARPRPKHLLQRR
jgi:hypothetical protein